MPRQNDARSFRYSARSKDDLRERANMRGGNFDSIFKSKFKLYKIRDGKNIIRILPPTWDEAKHYGLDLWINYNVGADNQAYLSLSMMKGEKDPLAEARKQADRDGDKELAAGLKPRQRILMWIIDRQDEDEGPQLFSCPFTLDKAIANLSFDEDTKSFVHVDGNTDPDEGHDVRFYKEGSGLKTDYPAEKIKIFDASTLCDDANLADDWLDFVQKNPLPTVLEYHDYDHISNTFNGQVGSRDDADEKPAQKGGTSRRQSRDEDETPKRRSRTDDVPENEEEDPPFEKTTTRQRSRVEPDEEEAPATGKPSIRDRLASRRRTVDED